MTNFDINDLFAKAYRITASTRPNGPIKEAELKAAEWFENRSVVHEAEEALEENHDEPY